MLNAKLDRLSKVFPLNDSLHDDSNLIAGKEEKVHKCCGHSNLTPRGSSNILDKNYAHRG